MRSSNLSICLNYSLWIFQGFSLFSYQCSCSLFFSNFDILSYLSLSVNYFFIFIFCRCFFSRQLCKFSTIRSDCQLLFYFCFSQPFRSQATLISYHSYFYLSTTFLFLFVVIFSILQELCKFYTTILDDEGLAIFFLAKIINSYFFKWKPISYLILEPSNSMWFSKYSSTVTRKLSNSMCLANQLGYNSMSVFKCQLKF